MVEQIVMPKAGKRIAPTTSITRESADVHPVKMFMPPIIHYPQKKAKPSQILAIDSPYLAIDERSIAGGAQSYPHHILTLGATCDIV